MIAKRIQVFGKVQGVFFRASAKNTATKLKVSGWVKNELDGSVVIEAEGSENQMSKFLEWCNKGSDFSRVTSVEVKDLQVEGFEGFDIRR